jgi:hypothetical protein
MRRHLARWGGAFALALSPALAPAQDGQPPTGPPVTAPQVNNNVRDRGAKAVPPRVTNEVLPPVPATASDPAPPGTRGVRVDVPAAGARAPAPGAAGTAAPGRGATAGIQTIEGVVTKIEAPGDGLPNERLRVVLDPAQTWQSFAGEGPQDLAGPKSRADQGADAAEDRADEGRAGAVEVVIHQKTHVYTFNRSPDGTDRLGANASGPEVVESRAGGTRPNAAAAPLAPKPSNFTNIREGSFLAVRYRKAGDLNDALNVSIIRAEEPQASAPGTPPAPAPGTRPVPAPAARPTRPGAAVPATPAPRPDVPATRPGPSVRVPAVPTAPVGPAIPK